MPTPVQANRLTWQQFEKRVADTPVVLPVGAFEQHGPHLPLGTDTTIATELARLVAERVDGLLMPPVQYGRRSQTKSGGGPTFPGTVDLPGRELDSLLREILHELITDGANNIFILNGHGENIEFINEAIDSVLDEGDTQVIASTWITFLSEEMKDELYAELPDGFPGWNAEHAGIAETSLMQYFAPETVHLDRIGDVEAPRQVGYNIKPAPTDTVPDRGIFLDPSAVASEALGEQIADDVVDGIVTVIEQEWD